MTPGKLSAVNFVPYAAASFKNGTLNILHFTRAESRNMEKKLP
jgi:hypothetical protein